MFDQTITIYNQRIDPAGKKTLWSKTVIKGVSWAGEQKVTTGDGLTSNDGYSVRIPSSISVIDPETGEYVYFLLQDEYQELEDPTGYWTAQNGDVVVRGEGPELEEGKGIATITKQFTECFTVIAVHPANMRRLLSHLRIEGK